MFKTDHNHRYERDQSGWLEFAPSAKPVLHIHKESSNGGSRDEGLNEDWLPI
jgi:hypothetical protein